MFDPRNITFRIWTLLPELLVVMKTIEILLLGINVYGYVKKKRGGGGEPAKMVNKFGGQGRATWRRAWQVGHGSERYLYNWAKNRSNITIVRKTKDLLKIGFWSGPKLLRMVDSRPSTSAFRLSSSQAIGMYPPIAAS